MSDEVFLFNPLPWDREISGVVSSNVVNVRGRAADRTAGRHFQDRGNEFAADGLLDPDSSPYGDAYLLRLTTVPGYGYATADESALVERDTWPFDERAIVETDRYRVEFDRERGGIASWQDGKLGCEWVDREAEDALAGFVHEEVTDRESEDPRRLLFRYPDGADWGAEVTGLGEADTGFQPDWHADRTRPAGVTRHRVYETPLGYDVRQRLDVPAFDSDVVLRVLVPTDGRALTVDAVWTMDRNTHPEATYLAFPLSVEDPVARVDVGGHGMRPGRDQLPGTCHDYYTAQRWVDLSGRGRGLTVGCPYNPLVQFGDTWFGDNRESFDIEDARLFGWVSNNYWETNFRAHQPGLVHARYRLSPHGPFDESHAHRTGLEAEHRSPLAQTAGEPRVDDAKLPPTGSLLDLPEPPVLTLHVRRATESADDEMEILLRNASDEDRTCVVDSAALAIDDAYCPSLDDGSVNVATGGARVPLSAREMARLRLRFD
jgi:hypothetical protein